MIDCEQTRKLFVFLNTMSRHGVVTRAYNLALQLEKSNITLEKPLEFIPDNGYYNDNCGVLTYLPFELNFKITLKMEYIIGMLANTSFIIPHKIIESEDISIVYNYLVEEMRNQIRKKLNRKI